MQLGEQQEIFAECLGKLLVWAYEHGYKIRLGDTYPGKYKHSAYGKHPQGTAIDLNLFRDGRWLTMTEDHAPLGQYWESLHPKTTWGGRWGDGNHYSFGETKR